MEKIITIKINGKAAEGSLGDLEKQAKVLRTALKHLNPETDKAKIDEIKKQYEQVSDKIKEVKENLGLVKKAQLDVAKASNIVSDGFKQIMTAAFWLELIQQVVELTKQFFELRKEIGSVSTEISKMTGTSGDELDALTAKVRGISKAFEVEATQINAAANSISKNLKVSFEEALELVQSGLASSAETEKADLLDYYEEYASALSDANIEADKFVKIISKQKELGVRDDFAIDAIKEFAIRATTDLPKMEKVFKSLEAATGETFANQMVKDIDTGVISIDEAINKVSGVLAKLPPESNMVKYAISEMFGAKGEDVGANFFQNLVKITSQTEKTSASLSAYEIEMNNLVNAQTAAAEAQKEFVDSFGGSSKTLDILGAKGTEIFFKFLTDTIKYSKPIADFIKELVYDFGNFGKNLLDIGKKLGFVSDDFSALERVFSVITTLFKAALLPVKIFATSINFLSTKINELSDKSMAFKGILFLLTSPFQLVIGLAKELYGMYENVTNALDKLVTSSQNLKRQEEEEAAAINKAKEELVDKYDQIKKRRAEELAQAENEGKEKKKLAQQESESYKEVLKQQAETAKKRAEERKKEAEELAKMNDEAKKLRITSTLDQIEADLALLENQENTAEQQKSLIKERFENEKKLREIELQEKLKNAQKSIELQKTIQDDFASKTLQNEKVLAQELKQIDEAEAKRKEEKQEEEKKQAKERQAQALEIRKMTAETALREAEFQLKNLKENQSRLEFLKEIFEQEKELRLIDYEAKLAEAGENKELMLALQEDYNELELQTEIEQKNALIAEEYRLAEAKATIAAQTFNTLKSSTEAVKELFAEQTIAAKIAGAAMKIFGIGEISANAVVEISNIWKNASANPINAIIPGAGSIIAGIETAGVVARKAKAIAEISGVKFKKGGKLEGKSHSYGGIKGKGSFANVEVEGGEFIVNKESTSKFYPVLEAINNTKFQYGGVLPSPSPSGVSYSGVNQIINLDSVNERIDSMASAFAQSQDKKIYLVMSEFEDKAAKKADIENY